jgi:hypothetical protein
VACAVAIASCEEPPSRKADIGRAGSAVSAERVVSTPIGPGRRPILTLWQVATISKGRVAVARVMCFMSARGDALSRPR